MPTYISRRRLLANRWWRFFICLFRDVFLLTVAKDISDRVNRYMLTEEGEKDFRKAIVCLYWPHCH